MIDLPLPPTVPIEIYASDCSSGSADCFPQDTVGGWADRRYNPYHRQATLSQLYPVASLGVPLSPSAAPSPSMP